MNSMFSHLIPPSPDVFFSRNDPDDPRLGDVVRREPDEFPGTAKVVLVGVPQDIGVGRNHGRRGAAEAPDRVRAMLYRLAAFCTELRCAIPDGFVFDAGDVDCSGELEDIHAQLEAVVRQICSAGLIPVVIGGGHDITYAAASGAYGVYGTLGMFNFDAHLDVRPPIPQRNSGTSFRMLIEEERLDPQRFVEFGIQPFANARKHIEWLEECGGTIRTLDAVREAGVKNALTEALRIATGTEDRPVYGTLDIDGVRSADAPGVSAPSPDGLSAADLLAAARMLGAQPDCVALDVVEVNPVFDTDNRTAKLAAHAIARFLAGVLAR